MAFTAADYQDYFNNDKFSDVDIEIIEDPGPGEDRKRALTIPGHSMVLIPVSAYCKAKLEHWPTKTQASDRRAPSSIWSWFTRKTLNTQGSKELNKANHTVQLLVPRKQTDIAVRLIQAVYQQTPALSDLSQQQLLHLLLLADRFEVPKVQTAVLAAFKALSFDQMEWHTAIGLLDLPLGLYESASFRSVIHTAENKLMQQLGDLEFVWDDKQLQDKLLDLPHAALLRLVQHDKTRVASESTVVYTILQWWEEQQQSYRDNHVQQLKQLMQQIRMQHLSSLYISTQMMNNVSVLTCFSTRDLAPACTCTDPQSMKALQSAEHPQLQQHPAWTAARRPASSRPQKLKWRLPLAELCDAVTNILSGEQVESPKSPPTVLQGHAVQLKCQGTVQVTTAADTVGSDQHYHDDIDTSIELQLGLFLMLPELSEEAVCIVTYSIGIEAADAVAARQQLPCRQRGISYAPDTKVYQGRIRRSGWGYSNMVTFPSVSSWSDVEAKLKQLGLVHPDGCLHCKVDILQMA